MSFDPNAIGNRIFTLRTNAKLSQEKLAEKLSIPNFYIVSNTPETQAHVIHPWFL